MTGVEEQVRQAAADAGLTVVRSEAGADFAGAATVRMALALGSEPAKELLLELSAGLDLERPAVMSGVRSYLAETATRLRNPRPDCYLTLTGLPLSFGRFAWPFHQSTSGADTSIVHGEVRMEDGEPSVLHAKVSASMTVTFREVVLAQEQPFAEGFIYNAIRKTIGSGPAGAGEERQSAAGAGDDAVLQRQAGAVCVQRHQRGAAAGVPGGQGVLAVGGTGGVAAGVAGRSAGCAVPEHDGRRRWRRRRRRWRARGWCGWRRMWRLRHRRPR